QRSRLEGGAQSVRLRRRCAAPAARGGAGNGGEGAARGAHDVRRGSGSRLMSTTTDAAAEASAKAGGSIVSSRKGARVVRRYASLAVLAALAAACATNPVTGKHEISFMSEAQEIQLGQQQ